MKADIITMHMIKNYGSALQTYATAQVLQRFGYESEFIDYWRKNTLPETIAPQLLQTVTMQKLKPIWGSCQLATKVTTKLLQWMLEYVKSSPWKFMESHVQLTPERYKSYEALQENPPEADIYVTGSDQVWNSIYNEGLDKAYYLDFAPADKPRIAFAASIGKSKLDADEILPMKKLLEKYKAISVREASAVTLLHDMGIQAQLILDPTLMLTGDEWKSIATYKKVSDKPYLLIYQLNHNPEMDAYAVELAQKKQWDLLRIGFGRSSKKLPGKCIMWPAVTDMLGLWARAACVITDSFHSTAFSLNLGTDFISVPPPRFSTRLESILQLTRTEYRMLKSYDDFSLVDRKIDKENVEKILDKKRDEGMAWLQDALAEGENQ